MTTIEEQAREIMKRPYTRAFMPEDVGFTAYIVEFSGCLTADDTLETANARLTEAALAWVMACLEQGQPIPEPCWPERAEFPTKNS